MNESTAHCAPNLRISEETLKLERANYCIEVI